MKGLGCESQNVISSSMYHLGPHHKISDRQTNTTENITSFSKEVITNQSDGAKNFLSL